MAIERIGASYLTWFDLDRIGGDNGTGWLHKPYEAWLRPFQFPVDQVVRSHLFPNEGGFCYSSMDAATGKCHSEWFRDLGLDFALFGETNTSCTIGPENNRTYIASRVAMQGFAQAENPIAAVYMLSLTLWNNGIDRIETYQGDNLFVLAHVRDIYARYKKQPQAFLHLKDRDDQKYKPLLLFYVSAGNNVRAPNGDPQKPFFEEWNGCIPSEAQFNPVVSEGRHLRDIFTVRFAVVAFQPSDYTSGTGYRIWPEEAAAGSKWVECGYASLRDRMTQPPTPGRSLERFERWVSSAKGLGNESLIVDNFNAFSTTDEDYRSGDAATLEVNNRLSHWDGSPNGDPWYMWNEIRKILSAARQ